MPNFSLLADPKTYRPCPNNMQTDDEFRAHWLHHFKEHFETVVKLAIVQYGKERIADIHACRDELVAEFEALNKNPFRYPELDLLVLDIIRQHKLLQHNIPDPYQSQKARENIAMLGVYPQVVSELDAHAKENPRHQLLLLVEGLFAGNIFDMGTMATVRQFTDKSVDFVATRNSLEGKRPWLVDHFDTFAARALPPLAKSKKLGYKKVVIFLDNAGPDIVLGVLPLARWLAKNGATVILAANRLPALNDVTVHELRALFAQVSKLDPVIAGFIAKNKIRAVDSGGIAPLLDLRHISDELNEESQGADLVILEGMGRAVGSNWDSQFKVDSAKIAMIKDPMIAKRIGGKIFDTVLRFDPAVKP